VISSQTTTAPITVQAFRKREVVVKSGLLFDAVTFENEQHDNRIELRSTSTPPGERARRLHGARPATHSLGVRSSNGTLHVQGLPRRCDSAS